MLQLFNIWIHLRAVVLYFICLMCHTMHVEVRGHLAEASSLLLPYRARLLTSCQTWKQRIWPDKLSICPPLICESFKHPKLPLRKVSRKLDNILLVLMKTWQMIHLHEIHVWFLLLLFTIFIVLCIKSIYIISPSMKSKKAANSVYQAAYFWLLNTETKKLFCTDC